MLYRLKNLLKKGSSLERQATTHEPKLSVIGLRVGGSFDIDELTLKLCEGKMTASKPASSHVIEAAGLCEPDISNKVFRFYTDDDAWLQVMTEGGVERSNIHDMKLFHYYDTIGINTQSKWDEILSHTITQPEYHLDGKVFVRSWGEGEEYQPAIHLQEKTELPDGKTFTTDTFVMLFERQVDEDAVEFLFLSAEEKRNENGFDRRLVISTGININSEQITIFGWNK